MDHEIYAQVDPSLRKTCVDDFPSSVPMDRSQWYIDRHESCEQQFSFASNWWNPCDDEGSFWSPVSYVTPARVRGHSAPAPSCDAAPPVFGYISSVPAGYAAPAPVVDYIEPVPAVYAAPTPVVEFISPAPGGYTAPAVDAAPAPVVEYFSPTPFFSVITRLFRFLGCVRNTPQCLTAVLNQRLFLLTMECDKDVPTIILWDCAVDVFPPNMLAFGILRRCPVSRTDVSDLTPPQNMRYD